MTKPLKLRISFDIEDELARAFIDEQSAILKKTGSMSEAAKSTIGRAALVEYLNRRGYDVKNTTAAWGGSRSGDEEEELGQIVAYSLT